MNNITINNTLEPETIDIHLKDLFWAVISRYRVIILVMIILGIILGGFQGGKMLTLRLNKAKTAELQAEYNDAMAEYNAEKERLTGELESIRRNIEIQEKNRENFLIMKIDPYNTYLSLATYYLDGEYQVNPGMSFQNTNKTGVLISFYRTIIDRLDYNAIFSEGEDKPLYNGNPVDGSTKQIVTQSSSSEGSLTIRVVADTEERASRIMNAIHQAILDTEPELDKTIGEHSITLLSSQAYNYTDSDLVAMQDMYENNLTKLYNSIDKNQAKLDALVKPVNNLPTKANIIKTTIKWGIIGLAAGLFLMAVLYIIRYIAVDPLTNPDELSRRYNTNFFGFLPTAAPKNNCFTRFDKWLLGRVGIKNRLTQDEAEKIIAASAHLYNKDAKPILLLGTAGPQALNSVAEVLKAQLPEAQVTIGGNLLENAEAINQLGDSNAVVLVEKSSISRYAATDEVKAKSKKLPAARHAEIKRELAAIEASNSQLIGVVMV